MATSSIAADATPDANTVYTCSSYDNAGTSAPTETQITDFTLTGSWAATTEAAAEEDDATDDAESTDDAAADGASNLVAGAAAAHLQPHASRAPGLGVAGPNLHGA